MKDDTNGSIIDNVCMDHYIKLSERAWNDQPVILRDDFSPDGGKPKLNMVVRRCGDNEFRCDIEDVESDLLLVSEMITKHDVIGYCLDLEYYKLIRDYFTIDDVIRCVAAFNDVCDNIIYEHVYNLLSVLRKRPEGL